MAWDTNLFGVSRWSYLSLVFKSKPVGTRCVGLVPRIGWTSSAIRGLLSDECSEMGDTFCKTPDRISPIQYGHAIDSRLLNLALG